MKPPRYHHHPPQYQNLTKSILQLPFLIPRNHYPAILPLQTLIKLNQMMSLPLAKITRPPKHGIHHNQPPPPNLPKPLPLARSPVQSRSHPIGIQWQVNRKRNGIADTNKVGRRRLSSSLPIHRNQGGVTGHGGFPRVGPMRPIYTPPPSPPSLRT